MAFAIVTLFSIFSERFFKASIFTAEILTVLKYIKGNDKLVIFSDYRLVLQALSSGSQDFYFLLPLHLFYQKFMQNLRRLYFIGSQDMLGFWGMSRQILVQRLL